MGWKQLVEYIGVVDSLPPPVKKQIWDGEKFVPLTLYRHPGMPRSEILRWLEKTIGQPGIYVNGRFWDISRAGNYIVMDEKVYTWYQMKWGNK